jgi:hypothetical protein
MKVVCHLGNLDPVFLMRFAPNSKALYLMSPIPKNVEDKETVHEYMVVIVPIDRNANIKYPPFIVKV